jgi:hypothetical protein
VANKDLIKFWKIDKGDCIMAKKIDATKYGSGRQKAVRVPLGATPGPTKQKRKAFEQSPDVASSDKGQDPPRKTWVPSEGIIGPGLVYFGPNQTPTPQQDAAPVLHDRPLNLHPHHRYLPIGPEMNKRADDAGIGCRVHTLAHLERARRRPSSKER